MPEPDPAELLELVEDSRLLAADKDPDHEVFSDDDWTRFLAQERYVARLAAARALETYAAHVAQVAGPVRGLLDIRVGGEQSAQALMRVAKSLRRGRGQAMSMSVVESLHSDAGMDFDLDGSDSDEGGS